MQQQHATQDSPVAIFEGWGRLPCLLLQPETHFVQCQGRLGPSWVSSSFFIPQSWRKSFQGWHSFATSNKLAPNKQLFQ